jgi:FtsH-binding integral membrane protein
MSHYSSSITKLVTAALYKSFGWMSLGLALTSSIAYLMAHSIYMRYMMMSSFLSILIFIAQIGIVVLLSMFKDRLSYPATVCAFLSFAALTGATLSVIFLIYDISSILGIFFIASGMFIFMATYGLMTKQNLGSLGVFAHMALFGLVILGLLNVFIKSAQFDYFLSFIGVIVFSILVAVDIQKIRSLLSEMAYDNQEQNKMAVYGALTMYLNFINLFLDLLRLLGKKRE